ncbi:hypothetical protein EV426DRAFT_707510 [Tirmania nivea]|nr:hypothetical protein EV426DRAFT_707510 [Tirmania nivea]
MVFYFEGYGKTCLQEESCGKRTSRKRFCKNFMKNVGTEDGRGLPVELSAKSWATVNWDKVKSRKELLAARARQLDRREDDIEEARKKIRESRGRNKAYFDKNGREKQENLEIGDMVLLYNSDLDKQWSQKLKNKWNGPYKIRGIREDRGTYLLEGLDSTEMKGIYAGDRIKSFFVRHGVEVEDKELVEEEDNDAGGNEEDYEIVEPED